MPTAKGFYDRSTGQAIDFMDETARAAASSALSFDTSQALTDAQKFTARQNLGLAATDDGDGNISFS